MERGKISSTGRGGKSKAPQHPQDIFALGSKSTVVSRDSDKRSIHKPSTSGVERKREASTFGSQPPGKRSRIGSPAESVTGTSLEIDPVDLVPNVLQALDTHNSDKLLGLLTGSIRLLKSQRSKPDPILCMSMLYLTKIRPNMFAHETVTQSLCSLLKREQGAAFKSKGNPLVFVLACNMLYAGHRDNGNWPDTFIKVYIEDALNERWWVDCSWCKCLVENIVTAFNTKQPPSHLIPTDNTLGTMSPSGSGSPLMGSADEDADVTDLEYTVFPRYSTSYESVEGLVLEAIKDQIQRRAAPDAIGKGFLKLLAATCGFPEIRMISASRLEAWLHSGKLWRAAQELLAFVCCNADATGPTAQRDHEVLAQLARMRLKTKPLQAAYVICLREMVSESPALLRSVVTHTIYNELSNVRSPNNMAVLAALVQAQPQLVPQAMADSYQELLLRPEEYIRPLRALTRECVRTTRGDAAALVPLARALAQPPPHEPANEVRERAFNAIADLFCLCCLIIASHSKHVPDYKQQICAIQAAAVGWLLETAVPIYRPSRHDYQLALNKIMFVEPAETYSKTDNWPPESERSLTYRVCCEAPLPQNTLLRVIFIGLAKEIPVGPAEVLELVETVVRRACALPPEDEPLLVDKLEIADYIFQLSQFHPPDNITLPAGYTAPQLAITSLYWRGWTLLAMLCAHNPDTLAPRAAALYPTLRALIDIAITNKPSIEWSNNSQAEAESERAAILQLESHLAAASNAKLPITEHNCRLPSQLTTLDPLGPARKPPASVLDAFQQTSQQLRLGRLLCRQPALLLELVQRHGTRRAMPWLLHLLQHDQLQLSVLPVQCLCEFLVAGGAWGGAAGGGGGGGGKAGELAAHLRRTVTATEEGARAVLHYYLQRLQHAPRSVRQTANRGLKLVLTQSADDTSEMDYSADVSPDEWIDALWRLPHWEALKEEVVSRVREACLVECEPKHLAAYIALLASYVRDTPHLNHNDLVLDLSQVLMERMTVCNYILPGGGGAGAGAGQDAAHATLHNLYTIFYHHMQKVRERDTGDAAPEEASPTAYIGLERLWLRWHGWHATLLAVQAHAHLKLLCAGPSNLDTNQEMYKWLLSVWVGSDAPQAFVPETREEAQLLPPWLRLHLVRSARPQLLEAGLRGLPAHELALYIQTFGMPVPAMSALLSALDACPTSSILRLGVERPYMSQLLRVQRARGATGGQAFASALRLTQPDYPPEDTLFSEEPLPAEAPGAWGGAPAQPALSPQQVGPLLAGAFGGAAAVLPDHAFTTLFARIQEEVNACQLDAKLPCPYTGCVVTYLQQSLAGGTHLAAQLLRAPAHAAPLLRALLPHAQLNHKHALYEISESLLKQYKCAMSPVVGVLREMSAGAGAGGAVTSRGGDRDLPDIPADATADALVQALESATPNTLEEIGNRIIHTRDTRLVVLVLSRILEKSQAGEYDHQVKAEEGGGAVSHVFSRTGLGCGLLLDWMSELQQETLGPEPQRQMRLMFRSGGATWRPLLVTLLAHRASWRTLHTCLTTLLEPDGGWSASSVLQFAETLIHSPRVWQGRDKTTPKHHTPEDLLRLRHGQLCVLVRYILQEAEAAAARGGTEATRCAIEARLPLLLQCCGDSAALLCACVQPDTTAAGSMLLLLLYMKVPKILKLLTESEDRPPTGARVTSSRELTRAAAASTSATDVVSHCLLCAIAATSAPHTKEQTHKIYRLEAGVRALWAQHPGAGARALPLVAALLRGAHVRSPSLTHLLAALEMVPDHALFADETSKELNDIVECLMSHASSTSGGGGSAALVHRVAALLRRYVASKPQRAQQHLHTYRGIVASVPALSGLVAAGGDAAPSSTVPPPHALAQLQQRRDNPEDLHWPLQELEAWGTRRGGAWGGRETARAILRAAAPLVAAPHAHVRNAALSLLVKLLPAVDDTTPALQVILECLESTQAELGQSVLSRLGELVCGMQCSAHQVLLQVFTLGVRARLPAEQALSKCVTTINLLRGC